VISFGLPLPLLSVSDIKVEALLQRRREWIHLRVKTPYGSAETEALFIKSPIAQVCPGY
jgi:hypothetical protein